MEWLNESQADVKLWVPDLDHPSQRGAGHISIPPPQNPLYNVNSVHSTPSTVPAASTGSTTPLSLTPIDAPQTRSSTPIGSTLSSVQSLATLLQQGTYPTEKESRTRSRIPPLSPNENVHHLSQSKLPFLADGASCVETTEEVESPVEDSTWLERVNQNGKRKCHESRDLFVSKLTVYSNAGVQA